MWPDSVVFLFRLLVIFVDSLQISSLFSKLLFFFSHSANFVSILLLKVLHFHYILKEISLAGNSIFHFFNEYICITNSHLCCIACAWTTLSKCLINLRFRKFLSWTPSMSSSYYVFFQTMFSNVLNFVEERLFIVTNTNLNLTLQTLHAVLSSKLFHSLLTMSWSILKIQNH